MKSRCKHETTKSTHINSDLFKSACVLCMSWMRAISRIRLESLFSCQNFMKIVACESVECVKCVSCRVFSSFDVRPVYERACMCMCAKSPFVIDSNDVSVYCFWRGAFLSFYWLFSALQFCNRSINFCGKMRWFNKSRTFFVHFFRIIFVSCFGFQSTNWWAQFVNRIFFFASDNITTGRRNKFNEGSQVRT